MRQFPPHRQPPIGQQMNAAGSPRAGAPPWTVIKHQQAFADRKKSSANCANFCMATTIIIVMFIWCTMSLLYGPITQLIGGSDIGSRHRHPRQIKSGLGPMLLPNAEIPFDRLVVATLSLISCACAASLAKKHILWIWTKRFAILGYTGLSIVFLLFASFVAMQIALSAKADGMTIIHWIIFSLELVFALVLMLLFMVGSCLLCSASGDEIDSKINIHLDSSPKAPMARNNPGPAGQHHIIDVDEDVGDNPGGHHVVDEHQTTDNAAGLAEGHHHIEAEGMGGGIHHHQLQSYPSVEEVKAAEKPMEEAATNNNKGAAAEMSPATMEGNDTYEQFNVPAPKMPELPAQMPELPAVQKERQIIFKTARTVTSA